MTGRRFPKSARLLKSAQFDRVMKRRYSASNGMMMLYAAQNDSGPTRLGLIVSRKCGNAVVRSRWKRALREAFRLELGQLPEGLDLVAIPRLGATPDVSRLRRSFQALAGALEKRLTTTENQPEQAPQ